MVIQTKKGMDFLCRMDTCRREKAVMMMTMKER